MSNPKKGHKATKAARTRRAKTRARSGNGASASTRTGTKQEAVLALLKQAGRDHSWRESGRGYLCRGRGRGSGRPRYWPAIASVDEGLDQAFNSLDAQREACVAFVQSQKHEGWRVLPMQYDDGGYSGRTLDRPATRSSSTRWTG